LNKKSAILYLLGIVVILWASFAGVDTSNPDGLIGGAVRAVGWMFIMLVLYWIEKQRLLPWRDMNL
jgi:hypothetical protein